MTIARASLDNICDTDDATLGAVLARTFVPYSRESVRSRTVTRKYYAALHDSASVAAQHWDAMDVATYQSFSLLAEFSVLAHPPLQPVQSTR